ncbi:MAG: hypothetical protein ABUK14_06840, partial [Desulfobacteria bacterium]
LPTERNELEVPKVLTVYGMRITGGPQKAGVPGLEEKPKIQAEWVPHVRFLRFHCTAADRDEQVSDKYVILPLASRKMVNGFSARL